MLGRRGCDAGRALCGRAGACFVGRELTLAPRCGRAAGRGAKMC